VQEEFARLGALVKEKDAVIVLLESQVNTAKHDLQKGITECNEKVQRYQELGNHPKYTGPKQSEEISTYV
jgi:hypothetical protein